VNTLTTQGRRGAALISARNRRESPYLALKEGSVPFLLPLVLPLLLLPMTTMSPTSFASKDHCRHRLAADDPGKGSTAGTRPVVVGIQWNCVCGRGG